jgi:hypothetical protein
MSVRIGFRLQVIATPVFHSLYDWYFPMMWLFPGACEDPENDTGMETHDTELVHSAMKCPVQSVRTDNQDAQQDAAHRMIPIAKPWLIRRRSELKPGHGITPVWIAKMNAHLDDLKWTKERYDK